MGEILSFEVGIHNEEVRRNTRLRQIWKLPWSNSVKPPRLLLTLLFSIFTIHLNWFVFAMFAGSRTSPYADAQEGSPFSSLGEATPGTSTAPCGSRLCALPICVG